VDHAGFVGGLDSGGDLYCQGNRLVNREWATVESIGEGFTIDLLNDEVS
jgi:hypothetical protein